MNKITLVTGGAKSGKSRHAEGIVKASGSPAIYIATGQALDDEMSDRIAAHKVQRGAGWETIEEPLDLCGALVRSDGRGTRLVDCMTLWLSNVFLAETDWEASLSEVLDVLRTQQSPVVLVSNEVGWGIVPMSDVGRRYRDASGVMNQRIAEVADAVVLVSCGLPLTLKG
ncbi:bifunctional adenosylcobinamide kinase/adenosylcobinamide-phosphate guanylyltransferase [Roseobacter sp. GAI101]|uniref:bifunctional adenosylcobinamide kinase/adenosylcobinamide-phosphate guanylyltransferase n=1 Tax=Roseobacter sp. (strain GAI101) TaxID=391589 RepID=UPI0001871ACB|nr:bifunctional adenosylcobinamide kinase/adenosylcobinamide-phosphate guanylyltransferase [Roseobacter sp. GAI101]EEB84074.1 bifunctional adenosylcobalamin biosynthesis protein CobU [Roseobacter sp. GAI101]